MIEPPFLNFHEIKISNLRQRIVHTGASMPLVASTERNQLRVENAMLHKTADRPALFHGTFGGDCRSQYG